MEEEHKIYNTVDELYRERIAYLISIASSRLKNSDLAIDVVHDVLAKSVKYFNDNPGNKVSERIIRLNIARECKKRNRVIEAVLQSYSDTDSYGE